MPATRPGCPAVRRLRQIKDRADGLGEPCARRDFFAEPTGRRRHFMAAGAVTARIYWTGSKVAGNAM
jgi:hypothetical protein